MAAVSAGVKHDPENHQGQGALAELARRTGLPADFLAGLGVEALGARHVLIPFYSPDGPPLGSLIRAAAPAPSGEHHWSVPAGRRVYGLERLAGVRGLGAVHLAGAAEDVWSFWVCGLPALAVYEPDALEAGHLAGVNTCYVHRPPGRPGAAYAAAVIARLGAVGYRGEAFVLTPPLPYARPRDMYVGAGGAPGGPEEFRGRLGACGSERAEVRPAADPDELADFDDLAGAAGDVSYLWPLWLQRGALAGLAAKPGTGKTRFLMDLLRRMCLGLEWPDGRPMAADLPEVLALWVPADHNHYELRQVLGRFGVDRRRVKLNAPREDVWRATDLDDPEHLAALERRVARYRPAMLVIDTVGNATSRSMSKPEEARQIFEPLQVLAARHRVCVVPVTHLNAAGEALGRRINEKVRTLIYLNQPDDPGTPGNVREVWVEKTFDRPPPRLLASLHDDGNTYRVQAGDGADGPRAGSKVTEAARELAELVTRTPGIPHAKARKDLTKKYSPDTFNKARDYLLRQGVIVRDGNVLTCVPDF